METNKKSTYKWCIVPGCVNTTTVAPDKLFFSVPYEPKRRTSWIKAVRREPSDLAQTSHIYVCEDHFNIQEDMDNYVKFKLMGGQMRMKSNVVPHIFSCQGDRKRAAPKTPRKTAAKRLHQSMIENILAASTSTTSTDTTEMVQCLEDNVLPSTSGTQVCENKYTQTISPPRKLTRSKKIQCNFRSIKSVACSPIKLNTTDCATSPLKNVKTVSRKIESGSKVKTFQKFDSFTTISEYDSGASSSETDEFDIQESRKELSKLSSVRIFQLLPLKSRLYLGLPEDTYYIINLLQKYNPVSTLNIYITLKKIRTGLTFAELADDFGMSESNASRIFAKSIMVLSRNLKKFIMWPTASKIKQLLPIAFIAYYSNVQSIIDCLEIEIEKPSNPFLQSLTWSEYKKANTLKYLISSTPNGIINFISTGYGGRASDALIVEESGFLDTLQPGTAVMADRGFKHIEHLLVQKRCTLKRPPTVENNNKSSKTDVLKTKAIASLRIHIERVIRRLREFKILKPHSCINTNLIRYTDHMIVIACALVNMQASLIK